MPAKRVLRFGAFEADLRAGELRKHRMRIKLQEQPFRVLALLLERPGDLITRDELRQRLWSAETFVDFDQGLNRAINRLREALADDAEAPRFIETLPKRGYRLLVPVEDADSPRPAGAQSIIGRRLGHYLVEEKIGAGGMGVVYRAHDEHLNRKVALKVLPPHALDDEDARRRFREEALAFAHVQHANIAAAFDFDTDGGLDFLAMEFVEGQTLGEKLAPGPLAEKEACAIGTQIAAALVHAHERGVIHRDLKPANVIIDRKTHAKVLDFGLAKFRRSAEIDETATNAAAVAAGTLPYMSPEQLRDLHVEASSDVWSLGVLLYQMVSGNLPFPGRTPADIGAAILREPPQPLPTGISERLVSIIHRCLEKDPAKRFSSASELCIALTSSQPNAASVSREDPGTYTLPLPPKATGRDRAVAWTLILATLLAAAYSAWRWLHPAPAPTGKVMVAILPFKNLSNDPAQEYFSDGLTLEMISQFGKLEPSQLGVIGGTTTFTYKGSLLGTDEIGHELRVDYIVDGAVQRVKDRVRITASVARIPGHGATLWSNTYDRDIGDLLALQTEVALAIAEQVQATLSGDRRDRLARPRRAAPQAHEAYLKGRYFWEKRSPEGVLRGIEYFKQAIDLDPVYAPAYVGLADCYIVWGGTYLGLSPAETFKRAKAAAEKALEIDSSSAEARISLATARWQYEWDWNGAEKEYLRALALNPSHANGRHWYAQFLISMGRFDEASHQIQRARDLDPLSLVIASTQARFYYVTGKHEEAIALHKKTLEMDSTFAMAHALVAEVYEDQKRFDLAIVEFQRADSLLQQSPEAIGMLGHAYAIAGRPGDAANMVDRLRELSRRRYVSPYLTAIIYAGLGQKQQTYDWLEKAFQQRSYWLVFVQVDPRLKPMRSDPRFQSLLSRMQFPQ